jgi:hypothetical protein
MGPATAPVHIMVMASPKKLIVPLCCIIVMSLVVISARK